MATQELASWRRKIGANRKWNPAKLAALPEIAKALARGVLMRLPWPGGPLRVGERKPTGSEEVGKIDGADPAVEKLLPTKQEVTKLLWLPGEKGLVTGPRRVERIFLPRSPHSNVALLRLAEAVETLPFRLGYPRLVRIGDTLWAVSSAGGEVEDMPVLMAGVVNAFESFPEWDMRLLKVGFRLPAWCSGGPLLNGLGEVVGVLVLRERAADRTAEEASFALTADALPPPG